MAPMFTKVFTGVFKNPNRTRLTAFLITALLVLGSLDSQAQFTIPLCSTSLQVATFPSMISCGSDPCTFSWTGSPGLSFSCPACDETTISSSTPGVYSATLHFNNGALNFTVTLGAVDADNDGYLNCDDCNDNNALEKPGQVWYKDSDNDGYGDAFSGPITQCARPIGYKLAFELVALNTDCDDNYNSVHPGAPEICDGLDNNCNNMTDEGVGATYYRDQDGDGYGNPAMGLQACSPPQGYVSNNSDCNDGSPLEKPGQVWYKDSDNDGYAATGAATITQCQRPGGYKAQSELTATTGDCNDNNGAIHPGASEVCDGVDNNCNNAIDEGVLGTYYRDQDEDGFGDPAVSQQSCSPPPGYVTDNTDCNDNNPSEKPGQVWYLDSDGDGYGDSGVSQVSCTQPEGYAPAGGDCNDNNPDIHPNAIDDVCNGIDEDCSGTAAADDVPPTAICRPVTVQLDANGMGTTSEAAVDNGSNDDCGIQSAVLSRQSFSCSDVGENTVTLTVTDIHNNVSTCPATVTVEDNVAPTALCRNVTVQLDASGNGSTSAAAVDNGSGDACGVQSAVLSRQSFSCGDVGANTVTLTVTDIHNNVSTCPATVTVEDNVAPTALCRNVTVQLDAGGNGSTSAAAVDNGSSDACGIQSAVLSGQSFSCGDVGANTVTLTVTDVNNNASTCTATVFVEDDINPVALCRNITVLLDGDGQGEVTAQQVDNGSSDACGILTLELNQTKVDCNNVGNVSVTLTATDINGNDGICSATVSVVDPVAPEALCQNVTVQLDENGDGSTAAAAVDNGSNDACGIQSAVLSGQSFSCSDVGANTVTLTVTDVNNNASTCTATVSVEDHVAPTALCRNVTVQFDENGEASTTAAAVDNGSNDACGVQSVVLSQEAFSCTDPGPVAVTLTVTDVNGNTSTCTASVTIEDHINPEVDCSAITVSFTGEASLTLEPEGMATASDNCAVTGFEADPPSISCADLGETLPVTVTVRDPSGNTASCIAHVTVEGLPCGWTSMSDGIGCTNGNDVDYDAQNGTFTMMATGCYTPGATSDESGYINYRLCGDGSITAHIAGLTLPGFAGIVMRESEAPGAKKVAMAYQGVNAIARYVRYATNGAAYPSYINTPGSRWLRIVRAGNVFRGYHSVNGVTWTYAFAVTVPMDDCIQVGLIAWGTNANSAVTATFDHVGIDPPFGATVQRGMVIPQVTDLPDSAAPGAELWPNPASGAVMLKLTGAWADAEAGQAELEVAVFDEFGRQLLTIQPDALFDPVINLDLSGRPAGVYLVRVKNARGTTIIQKLVLTDR
ncbi:MAG: hypothetical protein H6562_20300 [Lewinellaceae bacterium]|nr:hypothetical protein [Lewinellaceae bacterium]